MSLVYNGTTIDKVIYNGTIIDKVIYNGALVFTSASSTKITLYNYSTQNKTVYFRLNVIKAPVSLYIGDSLITTFTTTGNRKYTIGGIPSKDYLTITITGGEFSNYKSSNTYWSLVSSSTNGVYTSDFTYYNIAIGSNVNLSYGSMFRYDSSNPSNTGDITFETDFKGNKIGTYTFSEISQNKTIYISDSVKIIEEGAFSFAIPDDNAYSKIFIPSSVTQISDGPFGIYGGYCNIYCYATNSTHKITSGSYSWMNYNSTGKIHLLSSLNYTSAKAAFGSAFASEEQCIFDL